AFASGGRRRSEVASLRTEQFTIEAPVIAEDDTPLPSLSIHLGRTKNSGANEEEVVYLTCRPVDALNAWLTAAKVDG
ncbi:integrase, partial [Rhizobium ruizarguesonis]